MINWPSIFFLLLIHVGACFAPFHFSWNGLAAFVILSVVTGMSVTIGYHRLLTHASFETHRWVRWLLAFTGGLSGQGGVIYWVADHRKHHQFADKPGDPHSPREGFWWSHVAWTFPWPGREKLREHHERYCPDLLRDPVIKFISDMFLVWHVLLAGLLFWLGGWPLLLWGFCLRMVFVYHSTWFVNSATHKWGYRNYETNDDSTNLWWVALLSFGEGNHNNHHAHPRVANHGQKWWEFDPSYRVIQLMERCGLAWDVVVKHG